MPVSFPAHQGIIGPVKLRWPDRVDGTALCISAASPDLAYALGPWLHQYGHSLVGVVVFCVPFTLVAAWLTRWRAASGIFAALPDLGPLRIRSYRVLGQRRPRFLVTVGSALLGAGSHVAIDSFTHTGRWGANLLGINGVFMTVPTRGEFNGARVLQYLGHTLGSLAFVLLLLVISRRGLLEEWYGEAVVARARSVTASRSRQVAFFVLTFGPTVAAARFADDLGVNRLFFPVLVLTMCVLLAGAALAPDREN